jgi:hypothetical protein
MFFVSENRRWRIARTRLEHYTAHYRQFREVDVSGEPDWLVTLLLIIVSSQHLEDDWDVWEAEYRNTVSNVKDVTCLRAHAHLYALADRLGMWRLQEYIFHMFKLDSQTESMQGKIMVDGVTAVYTEIEVPVMRAGLDRLLNNSIVEAWMYGDNRLADSIGRDGFVNLMAVAPEFVPDLHARMMRGFTITGRGFDHDLNPKQNRFQYCCRYCGILSPAEELSGSCCTWCGRDEVLVHLLAAVPLIRLPLEEIR